MPASVPALCTLRRTVLRASLIFVKNTLDGRGVESLVGEVVIDVSFEVFFDYRKQS